MTIRFDKGTIRKTTITKEGFLRADAVVTRVGVFKYVNTDGSIRNELRHPDDVFHKDSLASMEMIPITNSHPKEKLVRSDNAKQLSVGTTGEKVRPEGDVVLSTLTVTHKDAIDTIKAGKQELSLGYELDLIAEAGTYNGERYDCRQTNIRYNHLAIVNNARAGSIARISLDSEDAVQFEADETETNEDDKNKQHSHQGDKPMKKITIKGIEYDAAPEVVNALNEADARADAAEKLVTSLTTEKTTLKANLDSKEDELKAAKEVNSDEKIKAGIESRLKLVAEAAPHLDEATVKTLATLSDVQIKEAVVKAKFPKANLDSKQENYGIYLNARFDSALEVETKESTVAAQRQQMNNDSKDEKKETRVDAAESKKNYAKSLTEAWKTKAA